MSNIFRLFIVLSLLLIQDSQQFLRYPLVYRKYNGKFSMLANADLLMDSTNIHFIEDNPFFESSATRSLLRIGFNILPHVTDQDGNSVVSPMSLSSCLGLLSLGARGQTKKELSQVLGHPYGEKPWNNAALGMLIQKMKSKTNVSSAAAMFVDDDAIVQADFLNTSLAIFQAPVLKTTFKDSKTSSELINQWILRETNGKIKNLIEQPLPPDTLTVAVSALYFKGNWEYPFLKESVKIGKFHVSSTETVEIPLMVVVNPFEYLKTPDYQMIGLPYQGKDMTMYFILPTRPGREGLQNLQEHLTASSVDTMLKGTHPTEVIVTIPKFKVSSKFSLAEALHKQGLKTMFDPVKADFGNLVQLDGKENIYVSEVMQGVDLEVTEEGTTAAAATYAAMTKSGKTVFRANRPFLFFIRHHDTGIVLFMGSIVKPVSLKN